MKYKKVLSRNSFRAFYFIILLNLFCGSDVVAQSKKASRPNVVLILADDMAVGDIGINNKNLNQTPNLNRLIGESVWFNRGYSGSAVCAPARAALLTGRYPHRTGVIGLDMNDFPTMTSLGKDEVTLANVFADAGYRTGIIGKWHLGEREAYRPLKRGFQHYVGFLGGSDVDTYFKFKLDVNGKYKKYDGVYLTNVLTDSAVSYVSRNKNHPFFLHLAYYAPHRPLGAPQALVKSYKEKGFDEKTAQVYAMIEVMDTGIGKLIHALDSLGIRENTIVIFASDNGPDPVVGIRFNQGLRGTKYTVFEGGVRVPIIMNWKGRLQQSRYDRLFHFVDVLPTLANMCGISLKQDHYGKIDGRNVTEELEKGESTKAAPARYWQWNRGVPFYTHNAAIIEGDWKLVLPPVTQKIVNGQSALQPLLFNLKTDPSESNDVSEKHQKVSNRLRALLEDWSRKMEMDRLRSTSFDN